MTPLDDGLTQDAFAELYPRAGARLVRLTRAAQDAAQIPWADFYQLGDWLEPYPRAQADALGLLATALFLALEEGSLCIELSPAGLMRRLGDLLEPRSATAWIDEALAHFHAGAFADLIGQRAEDAKPIIAWQAGGRRFLYFQKYLRGELEFQAGFRAHLQEPSEPISVATLQPILREVLTEAPLCVGSAPLRLDRDQTLALGLALSRPFVLISGGPGTGKTSIVVTLLRCLLRAGYAPENIALAAPTGRAAQRLSDSIRAGQQLLSDQPRDLGLAQIAAGTLHSLLGYHPKSQTFRRHAENPLPADVVLIDEVSMVGVVLMSKLLRALKKGTQLILLGDKNQLPSVDAGATLAQMVTDQENPAYSPTLRQRLNALFPSLEIAGPTTGPRLVDSIVYLRTNHRSRPAIHEVAESVNRQDEALVERLPRLTPPQGWAADFWEDLQKRGGAWLWEQVAGNVNELKFMLELWAHHTYLLEPDGAPSLRKLLSETSEFSLEDDGLRVLFERAERTRLLTLIREGPWGSIDINRYLENWLRSRMDRLSRIGLFAGAPVLIVRNDPNRGLFNGDLGLTLRLKEGLRVVFARQGSFVGFAPEALPAWEWGFAMTVHKSQGSEFDQVLLMLPPRGGRRLLTKELVYTGITRAKKLAILCGTADAVRAAIQRKIVRESGLEWSAEK